jgi:hypothetical protein
MYEKEFERKLSVKLERRNTLQRVGAEREEKEALAKKQEEEEMLKLLKE